MNWRSVGCIFLVATAALPAQSPPDASFHATTQLIQVSVIAQDQEGKPVTDLRGEDFQIFDNGARQDIRLFLTGNAESPLPGAQAPGAFTNQIAPFTWPHSGYSIILFDDLDTGWENTSRARLKALEALRAIPPRDRIAMYSLFCQFRVIREFTSDRESLLRELSAFKPGIPSCAGGVSGDDALPVTGPPSLADKIDPGAAIARARATADAARIAALQSGTIGDREMIQIADHVAGIPGRKNLIWIAQKFPLSPAALQRLINAGVAIYPLDAIGSTIALASEKEAHAAPIRALAKITGGVASIDRDDLDIAIRESLEDGHNSYTLGFYSSGEPAPAVPPRPHQLRIQVSRPGIALRYRTSYKVEPPPPVSANPAAELIEAMNRPVDATSIPITASVARDQDRLDLSVIFDLSSLDLALSGGLWKGSAEVAARFMTAEGVWVGDALAQTVRFNLRPASYAALIASGAAYHRQIKTPAKAVQLKLLVGSPASGKIGTLTIPLSEVKPGAIGHK